LIEASPALRRLLDVKWINAITRASATFKLAKDAVTADVKVETDPDALEAADVPIAPGATPPPLIGGRDEVKAGARDPLRILRFVTGVARALAPQRVARVDAVARTRGVDLEQQLGDHLRRSGALAVDPFSREFAARVGVRDPAGVEDGLRQLAPVLPGLAAAVGINGVGVGMPATGERFYALARPKGSTIVFGVSGPWFVVSNRVGRAAALASEPTTKAPKDGSVVVTADARELAARFLADRLDGIAGLAAPLAVRALGDATAWATGDRSRVFVHARLEVR
jgi:hypothetical protein